MSISYSNSNVLYHQKRKLFLQNIKKISDVNPNAKLDWIYFENDPESCLKNVERRNREEGYRKVDSFIKNLHQFYKIPDGATTVQVYKR